MIMPAIMIKLVLIIMITDMAVFEVVVVLVRLSSKQFISDTHQPFRQTFLHNLDYIVMMSVLSI